MVAISGGATAAAGFQAASCAAGIKKTRFTIPAALTADITGFIAACLITKSLS